MPLKTDIGSIIEALSTGDPYSVMADRLGYADGLTMRRACLRLGLRRQIQNRVVVIIAEPT